MSGLRGAMKDGWHPKARDGGKESWRGDFKGFDQVAGWMGKGRDDSASKEKHASGPLSSLKNPVASLMGKGRDDSASKEERVSRPLSSLKDPATFGPPPKHINYHGPAAVPDRLTPDRRGLGAPLTQEEIHEQNVYLEQTQAGAEEEDRKPPLPYRADRTGLPTNNLPPPPVRRLDSPVQVTGKAKPSVPPRLPARRDSGLSQSPSPPPAYTPMQSHESEPQGQLNQHAVSHLGRSGVSVPALGIREANASRRDNTQSPAQSTTANSTMNQLQARFSNMSTSHSPTSQDPPAQGTTWAEKQAAMRTAQNARNDPSSVKITDARSAISAAKNFRERHDDQIQSGKKKISGVNEKYGITKRINGYFESPPADSPHAPPPPPHPNLNRSTSNVDMSPLNKRKPPAPPPPRKKPELRTTPVHTQSPPPPPLPLGTKPR